MVSIALDQGGKLTEEIVQNKALLKACCASTPEAQVSPPISLFCLFLFLSFQGPS